MDRAQSDRLGRSFNASVYGMLGVPALMLGGLVFLIARNARAQARRDRDLESRDPIDPGAPTDPPEPPAA